MLIPAAGTQNHQGACSVAASYKPPMLVTRVRLPACALLVVVVAHWYLPAMMGGKERARGSLGGCVLGFRPTREGADIT